MTQADFDTLAAIVRKLDEIDSEDGDTGRFLHSCGWFFDGLNERGIGLDDVDALLQALQSNGSLGLMRASELEEDGIGLDQQLLGPLLERGARTILLGHTGQGKTTLAAQMVAAAVCGEPFLDWRGRGRFRRPLRVLLIDLEQKKSSLIRVLREAGIKNDPGLFVVHEVGGLDLGGERTSKDAEELESKLALGFDLVVLDPLYKAHRSDPNDAQAVAALMRRLDDWRDRYGFALLLLHHPRKPQQQWGKTSRLTLHDSFGSSVTQWGAEIVLGLEKTGDGRAVFSIFKLRDSGEERELRLLFDRETGFRLDTTAPKRRKTTKDEVRALLTEQPGLTQQQLQDETGKSERAVRDALKDLDAESDGSRPARWCLSEST